MPEPYSWLKCSALGFFDEGGELSGEKVDLMDFAFDEDHAFGMTEKIIVGARQVLTGAPPEFARAALRAVDLYLEQTADDLNLIDAQGVRTSFKDVNTKQLNQLDFIPLVLGMLDKSSILLGDLDQNVDGVEITPSRFCAAFALRMAFNATREYLGYPDASDLREYYLMQAAVAYGLMQSLAGSASEVSGVVVSSVRRGSAKAAASARWDNDPTRAMWAEIREEWVRWQEDRKLYRYPRDFRRAMQLKFPELVDGTLKNRMSKWGRGNS